MKKLLVVLAAAAMLTACDSIKADKSATSETTEHHEGDGHDHGAEGEHGHDHGEHHELGTTTTAGIKYEVLQIGHIADGEQAVEIVLAKDSPKPAAIRVWIGNEAGQGSMKTRADGTGPAFEMHVEAPDPAPADSKLWVEIETQTGEKAAAAFALKAE